MKIQNKTKAFTLIELVVVVAIIAVLSATVIVSLNAQRVKSRNVRRISDVRAMYSAIKLYENDNDAYPGMPATTAGLTAQNSNAQYYCESGTSSCWTTNLTASLKNYLPNMPTPPTTPDFGTGMKPCGGTTAVSKSYRYIFSADSLNFKVESPMEGEGVGGTTCPAESTNDGGSSQAQFELYTPAGKTF